MYERYKIHITFTDDTTEITDNCDNVEIRDGVLHLYYRRYNAAWSDSEHVGSWPLINIKKYIKKST